MRWAFLAVGSVLGSLGMLYVVAALLPASREDPVSTTGERNVNLLWSADSPAT